MPIHDFLCESCGHEFDQIVLSVDINDDVRITCLSCDKQTAKRIFRKAPVTRMGAEGSDRQVKAMQKASRDRFYKKELDEMRGKL